jgi:hypothetical protein
MTHDELRDYIDKFDCAGMANEPTIKALRAVVELHKPHPISTTESIKDGKWQSNIHCDDCHSVYPCPTIQAIEKELG